MHLTIKWSLSFMACSILFTGCGGNAKVENRRSNIAASPPSKDAKPGNYEGPHVTIINDGDSLPSSETSPTCTLEASAAVINAGDSVDLKLTPSGTVTKILFNGTTTAIIPGSTTSWTLTPQQTQTFTATVWSAKAPASDPGTSCSVTVTVKAPAQPPAPT